MACSYGKQPPRKSYHTGVEEQRYGARHICPNAPFYLAWGQEFTSLSHHLHQLERTWSTVETIVRITGCVHRAPSTGPSTYRVLVKTVITKERFKFLMLKSDNRQSSLLLPWTGPLSFPLIHFLRIHAFSITFFC